MRILFPLSPYNQQRQFQKPVWVYPVHLAMYATYLRDQGYDVKWGDNWYVIEGLDKVYHYDSDIDVPFLDLPAPDRIFTDAKNPRWQSYGNYKYHPATHMQVAHGCWWGLCKFCVERKNDWKVRDIDSVERELNQIKLEGFREVFDDSGTFPRGRWLDDFLCIKNPGLVMGCNMRMVEAPYDRMKRWGFRMILFGLESANQNTLDKVNKGVKVEDYKYIMRAAKVGLEPHIAVMFGYPWETYDDSMETVKLAHYLILKGYAKTVQASVFTNPRRHPDPNDPAQDYVQKVYSIYRDPRYWFRKIYDLRNIEDLIYLIKRIGHLWEAQ